MTKTAVMIHGAFCASWAFDKFKQAFEAKGWRVVVPTLRFHDTRPGARAPDALATTSVRDYAADLESLIDGMKEKPVLIGHSMGGLIAQMLAARGRAAAAVMLAPSAPWGIMPSTMSEIASAHGLYFAGPFWSKVLTPEYWIAAANSLDKMPEDERQKTFARFVPESGRATFEIMHWMWDTTRATHVPTADNATPLLFLAGDHDRVNPPATVKRIAQRYRGHAEYRELRGMSHWLPGEPGWEKVAELSRTWLEARV